MSGRSDTSEHFPQLAASLSSIARSFYARGWAVGTSGNLSAVVDREPLRLAMSPSGVDKGELVADQFLMIDEHGRVLSEHDAKPSDESSLHLTIVKELGAGAVLHTHSIWNTMLSDLHATEGGLAIEGYEMLKGLHGVKTHQHREWLPIIENSQDMLACAYAHMNKPAEAVKWLEVAARDGFPCYPLFARDSFLDPLRKDPAFLQFMTEMKTRWDGYRREFG